MAQDIREMFKNEKEPKPNTLPKGHQKRFEDRLEKEFPKEKEQNSFFFLKIAAVLVVALGVGFFFLNSGGDNFTNSPSVVDTPTEKPSEEKEDKLEPAEHNFQLSEVSPEFKKIEDYYMASLNIELSKINITSENKELIDSFMKQMAELFSLSQFCHDQTTIKVSDLIIELLNATSVATLRIEDVVFHLALTN